jgi:hypothetical protein
MLARVPGAVGVAASVTIGITVTPSVTVDRLAIAMQESTIARHKSEIHRHKSEIHRHKSPIHRQESQLR